MTRIDGSEALIATSLGTRGSSHKAAERERGKRFRSLLLLFLVHMGLTAGAMGPRKTEPRSHIVARLGLTYAVPTGHLTVPDIAVYGRQGDPTLAGFRSTDALGARFGLEWWYTPIRKVPLSILCGLEWYLRPTDLEGFYTNGSLHITRRAVRNQDIDIPIGIAWRGDRLRVEAGIRVLWSYSQSDVAYDGRTKIETIGTAKNMYPPKDRG